MQKIVSLFDYTGNWPRYFRKAGYEVELVDIKHGSDIFRWRPHGNITGVLAAPPCTDFSGSGARWWAEKDRDGRTKQSLRLIDRCLKLIHEIDPQFWILENPVGRLKRLRPEMGDYRCIIHPWMYAGYSPNPEADRYSKATCLWGEFRLPPKLPLEPVMYTDSKGHRGSWQWMHLGGTSDRTKTLRSATPLGLAKATFIANRL